MAQKKLSRAEIKAGLDSFPIESLLSAGVGKTPQLTTKQKAFAKAVAMGETKAEAYRKTYKANPAPSTITNAPYRLAADSRISAEIDAYKVAIEAEKHRTPAQLKALLVQQLVQHSIDEDFPPAQRVQCLKLLGSLFEVGAFVERKEITTVKHSTDIRTRLLETLRDVTDAPVKDDALELLAEISGAGSEKVPDSDPTTPPPAISDVGLGREDTHTIPRNQSDPEYIPRKQSSEKSNGGTPSSFRPDEVVSDFDK